VTALAAWALGSCCVAAAAAPAAHVYRIARVVDGDTVDLTNGARIRLVQVDTPEVYFGVECYGREARRRRRSSCHPARPSGSRSSLPPTASTATGACSE